MARDVSAVPDDAYARRASVAVMELSLSATWALVALVCATCLAMTGLFVIRTGFFALGSSILLATRVPFR